MSKNCSNELKFCEVSKVIYTKYSKHWPYTVAHTIDCHTHYSWNIMCHKSEGNCGLWVLNEITLKKYAESLKKIVGAVWELPAK